MKLPTEIFGDVVVVHSPEELGAGQADEFEAFLASLQPPRVVLDMDNTEAIDSAGLTSLLNAFDRLRETDGDVKIATTNTANRKILEMTRLEQQLEVFDSVIDAVKSYR